MKVRILTTAVTPKVLFEIEVPDTVPEKERVRVAVEAACAQKVSLAGAELIDVNLTRAKLVGVDLRTAVLVRSNLHQVDLRDSDLTEACLNRTILFGANLSGAKMHGTSFDNAVVEQANLAPIGADFKKVLDAMSIEKVRVLNRAFEQLLPMHADPVNDVPRLADLIIYIRLHIYPKIGRPSAFGEDDPTRMFFRAISVDSSDNWRGLYRLGRQWTEEWLRENWQRIRDEDDAATKGAVDQYVSSATNDFAGENYLEAGWNAYSYARQLAEQRHVSDAAPVRAIVPPSAEDVTSAEENRDYLYPCTIVEDSQGGMFSKGECLAWHLEPWNVPEEADAGYQESEEFWKGEGSDYTVGRGKNAHAAYNDLVRQLQIEGIKELDEGEDNGAGTFTSDRYNGLFSGSKWIAWTQEFWDIPKMPFDRPELCVDFWATWEPRACCGDTPYAAALRMREGKYGAIAVESHSEVGVFVAPPDVEDVVDAERRRDYLYPCTIVNDRYSGAYSGAAWTAWAGKPWEVPEEIEGSDNECEEFWQSDHTVGKGATAHAAYNDLIKQIRRRWQLTSIQEVLPETAKELDARLDASGCCFTSDRYNSLFSLGKWIAWDVEFYDVPRIPFNDDPLLCADYWATGNVRAGRGATPYEAALDRASRCQKAIICIVCGCEVTAEAEAALSQLQYGGYNYATIANAPQMPEAEIAAFMNKYTCDKCRGR